MIDNVYHVGAETTFLPSGEITSNGSQMVADISSTEAVIKMPNISVEINGQSNIGGISISAEKKTTPFIQAPSAIASYEIKIIVGTGYRYSADVTVDAQIPNGHRALAYYIDESGDLIPVEVVNYTSSTVTFRTTHTTPFVIMSEEIPATPSVPDDDEDDYPFIPGQNVPQTSSGSDDRTTLVAAAAAVVVIMLAVVALMTMRKN